MNTGGCESSTVTVKVVLISCSAGVAVSTKRSLMGAAPCTPLGAVHETVVSPMAKNDPVAGLHATITSPVPPTVLGISNTTVAPDLPGSLSTVMSSIGPTHSSADATSMVTVASSTSEPSNAT